MARQLDGIGNRFGSGAYDERRAAPEAYEALFARLGPAELVAERERLDRRIAADGVSFGAAPFVVDPVPRIIPATEWDPLVAGLEQRIRALNAFVADAYGERRAVGAGVVPGRLLETADWYERSLAGSVDRPVVAAVAGPDLVRGPGGGFRVLEDNMRAPSGLAYLLAARSALAPLAESCGLEPRPLEPAVAALGAALRGADPSGSGRPRIVLVNDGPGAGAAFEHRLLARLIGMEVAATADLRRRGDRLLLGDEPVDVLYRRVDDERLETGDGRPTELGELIARPLRSGGLACVNPPGTGIADDKGVHVYTEAMIRFYLGEEPLIPSVPGWDLGDPAQLEAALPRLSELVIKPRSEFGGRGVTIGPLAGAAELAEAAAAVRADPGRWVAQEPVELSVHPTVAGTGLAPRHVDLRPFVVTAGDRVSVAAGGLSRFAPGAGEMVVNSRLGGGAKDTWIL